MFKTNIINYLDVKFSNCKTCHDFDEKYQELLHGKTGWPTDVMNIIIMIKHLVILKK